MAVQRMQCDEARREMLDQMSNVWRGGAVEGARRKQKAYEAMCPRAAFT